MSNEINRPEKREISIEDLTTKCVRSVLNILDDATDWTTDRGGSPCGDKLAFSIHETIKAALRAHFKSDFAPAFIVAKDLED